MGAFAARKIFVTGLPGSGKSTLVEKLLARAPRRQGFVTREMRAPDDDRVGFEVVTAAGARRTLAHVGIASPHRVARYGVDAEGFGALLPPLAQFGADDVLYIDEIGQMEFFAPGFRPLVERYMAAPNVLLAGISKVYSDETTAALLAAPGIALVDIDSLGREEAYAEASRAFDAALRLAGG